MSKLIIGRNGNDPEGDGAVNLYESPEIKGKDWFDRKRRIIFVNGMDNEPRDHRQSAEALSTLQACPVTGVYNATDGVWADLVQCLSDKANFDLELLPGSRLLDLKDWANIIDTRYAKAKSKFATKADFVRRLIAKNPATAALFDLLHVPGYGHSTVAIYAHSQGNLITSNALTALALADGEIAIQGRLVYSFGSPCRYWPPGIIQFNHAFNFDPVSVMDYRFRWGSIKVGWIVGHAFEKYMANDPAFVVNRFRWGGYGVTFSMDEEGLSSALVEMGVNPDRLYSVFSFLESKYNNDADDVALLYVQKLRKAGKESVLRALAKAKEALVSLLIKCLEKGWTTGEEKEQALFLRSLLK